MNEFQSVAAFLLSSLFAANVCAQTFHVRVERATVSPCSGGIEHDADHPANQPLSLNLSTCAEFVYITASSGVDIPRVTLTGGPSFPLKVAIGSTYSTAGANPTPTGRDRAGLDASSITTAQVYGGIGRNLTGSILAKEFVRFDADGAITAAIVADQPGNLFGPCIVEASTISSSGSVWIKANTINRVVTTGDMAGSVTAGVSGGTAGTLTLVEVGGDCTADIRSWGGNITTLNVAGDLSGPVRAEEGMIGTIDVTGVIDSPLLPGSIIPIRAKNGIDRLFAASASAHFTVIPNDGTAKIGLFKMESGNFSGVLNLKTLTPLATGSESGIIVNGDITGTIRFFTGGTFPGTIQEPIKIQGALTTAAVIQYDGANSLTNQVIINTPGITDTGGWGGTVKVNNVTLSPTPHYDNLPSSFGGGAIGLAGFTFHPKATDPQHNAVVTTAIDSAVIDHYGPVIQTVSGAPIRVDRRVAGSTNEADFVNVTNLFTYTVESTSPYRHVTVTRTGASTYESGYEYRLRPVIEQGGTARLKCRYDSNAVSVDLYDYRFTVLPPYDMNGDDLVNLTDVALWPGDPRDFNNDQAADTVDFGMLIQAAGNP